MKINIVGSVFDNSGYSSHTVQLARALKNIGVDVAIETQAPEGYEWTTANDLVEMIKKEYDEEINIFIGLPDFWRLKLSERPKKFYGFFIWECKEIPEGYLEILKDERIDGILVASKWQQEILKTYGVESFVVSHGVDSELFRPVQQDRDEEFTFLFNKGWAKGKDDRSGFDLLLRAFFEEFEEGEKVKLNCKINTTYNPHNWSIQEEIKKLNIDMEKKLKVNITLDMVPIKELYKFYNTGDCLVIPTKGEAFGLTYIEAMACKVPCIATNFGGQIDFINKDNGWLIDYSLEPSKIGLIGEGCNWAMPDIKDLRKKMREAFELSKNEKMFNIKKRLSFDVSQQYSWNASAKKIKEIVEM